jgi:hypothetical protein
MGGRDSGQESYLQLLHKVLSKNKENAVDLSRKRRKKNESVLKKNGSWN